MIHSKKLEDMLSGDIVVVGFRTLFDEVYAWPSARLGATPMLITLLYVHSENSDDLFKLVTYIGGKCLMNKVMNYEVIT